jgi:hypothetical protein
MSFPKDIPGDDSDIQIPPSEPKMTPGYVKNKIKGHKSRKRASQSSRARVAVRGSLSKIIKKANQIADLLSENDQRENLRVIRRAKKAKYRWYNPETKQAEWIDDHKTQLAATALDLAYREGRPRERSESVHLHATTEDFKLMLARIRESKGAQRRLPAQLVKTLENGGKTQDVATDDAQNRESKSDSMTRDTSDSK